MQCTGQCKTPSTNLQGSLHYSSVGLKEAACGHSCLRAGMAICIGGARASSETPTKGLPSLALQGSLKPLGFSLSSSAVGSSAGAC